jgi:glycosyltransferase involved in cell wall biosynthesis
MDRSKPDSAAGPIAYSVVVPFYNEQDVARKLYDRITRVMRHVGRPYEVVLVNDGSGDRTAEVLEDVARSDEHVVFVDLRRNFGQATALQAGFDQARGEVIIAMDGDLQHDPYEIPLFIRKIDEGYDIASGWRVRRGDDLLFRRIPSRLANILLAKVSGVALHDFGTTFKAYRRAVLQNVRLYGDMHRYVPAICARLGARICEVPIKNVRRRSGRSHYGVGRTFRVAMDLLTVRFISGYLTRPLHFFGKWSLLSLLVSGGILGYLGVRKLVDHGFSIMRIHGPLMALGFMLLALAVMFLATGLIGELLMRIYFEATGAKTYAIRRLVRKGSKA